MIRTKDTSSQKVIVDSSYVPNSGIAADLQIGSLVIANAYAMDRDESVYSNPEAFHPERYIPKAEGGLGEPFPVGHFGFGRRYVSPKPDNSAQRLQDLSRIASRLGKCLDRNCNYACNS